MNIKNEQIINLKTKNPEEYKKELEEFIEKSINSKYGKELSKYFGNQLEYNYLKEFKKKIILN